jgi:hypothetical protein
MSEPGKPADPSWPSKDEREGDEPDIVTAEAPRNIEHPSPDLNASGQDLPAPARPVNWRTLTSDEAEQEWLALNEWVHWLRREFGLTAAVLPPYWHRHAELVWELSALHQRWLAAYDPYQDPSAPLVWMAEFSAARQRLHDWVAISGTRLDRDRPTRQTAWPGEDPPPIEAESRITHREDDFVVFVLDDVRRRREAEAAFLRDQLDLP